MRILLAAAFLILGLALAAVSIFNGQPVVALALALAGGYAGLGIFLGIGESLMNPSFQLAAAVIGAVGILGVFFYNRAFDKNLQGAHVEALSAIATIELSCRSMSTELRDIQRFGVAACASQGNSDQIGAVIELGKSLHFGPTLTLVDAGGNLASGERPATVHEPLRRPTKSAR